MRWTGRINRFFLRSAVAAWCTGWLVRVWMLTLRYRVDGWGELQQRLGNRGFVLVLWHDSLILPLGHDVRRGMLALVSPDRDGEFLVRVLQRQGVGAVRGSTNRSGVRALRESFAALQVGGKVVVTPDGPRGPRRTLQDGALWLATQASLPIVALGAVPKSAWHARSWDRMCAPRPFTCIGLAFSEPLLVTREEFAHDAAAMRARLVQALEAAEARARQKLELRNA